MSFTLLQEMIAREPSRVARNRSQFVHDHPDVVQALMTQIDPFVEALSDLGVLESVMDADIHEMRREMRSRGTLPRIASILLESVPDQGTTVTLRFPLPSEARK